MEEIRIDSQEPGIKIEEIPNTDKEQRGLIVHSRKKTMAFFP
jgi:hypothetical protein